MNTIPTQLFIGTPEILEEKTEFFLQKQFCKEKIKNSSCYCNQCRKIKNRQHESILFISPEKNYSVKDVEIIFEKINLSLDKDQKFFFILEKAQNLNIATANKLLKILEEPPNGYFFILQTNNKNSILPTIISRSHIINFKGQKEINTNHPITSFFYKQNLLSPLDFDKELKALTLSDNQSISLLNEMIHYYSLQIISFYKKNNFGLDIEYNKKVLEFLKNQLKMSPRSGSSKLFWKNIYIKFPKKDLFS
ncbi:hypothetical protein GF385_03555 [Candidatus Dependentiae bacterium]|nr:hypothetical protein [Candidatus Dependentiae bacterium]